MADKSKCLKCGVPLTPDARDGVCPKCLLGQALALMEHPNIARVFDGGATGELGAASVEAIKEDWGALIRKYPGDFAFAESADSEWVEADENSAQRQFQSCGPALTIRLGEQNAGDGLHMRLNDDGVTEAAQAGGMECRRVRTKPGTGSYIYFAIDPRHKPAVPADVMVEVQYFDTATGQFYVQYDAVARSGNPSSTYASSLEKETLTAARRWQTAYFHLKEARFKGSQNAGADFRLDIQSAELWVRRVSLAGLAKTAPVSEAPPPVSTNKIVQKND